MKSETWQFRLNFFQCFLLVVRFQDSMERFLRASWIFGSLVLYPWVSPEFPCGKMNAQAENQRPSGKKSRYRGVSSHLGGTTLHRSFQERNYFLRNSQNFQESQKKWVVVSNIFYFHPYLGKTSNLTNIFQRGWNHQLEKIVWQFGHKHYPNAAWYNLVIVILKCFEELWMA